ncbi:MAG: M42 family peptidase, partial [Oscillospiraceae bacterium]|nr:M42 family peptidase [Oscillospiraceae bacterium]
GNLLVHVRGEKPEEPGKKVLLAAHMDEVGVIITSITEDGYLKFDFVGGVDRRVVLGKQVILGEKAIHGIIGLKAIHLTEGEERNKVPPLKSLYIDIGVSSKEEAEKLVSLGDVGTFPTWSLAFGNGYLMAKAIDDRVGCTILLELIRRGLPRDAWFAFTVQEEVGCRGSQTAAWRVRSDYALILEGTTAADLPSQSGGEKVCCPGKGPVIPFMDGGSIYDPGLYRKLTALAEKRGIPWQTKTKISGGTDASAIQRGGAGARVAAISAAVRNIHSPSCVICLEDMQSMYDLAHAFLEEM